MRDTYLREVSKFTPSAFDEKGCYINEIESVP